MKSSYLHFILPIVLLYVFFAYPDKALDVSITPLGRLLSILLIVYYTYLDKRYGVIACIGVILYYQMDCVEGMAQWSGNTTLTDLAPTSVQDVPKQYYQRSKDPSKDPSNSTNLFYQKPDKRSILLEDDSKKITNVTCCSITKKCTVNVVDQLNVQEELMYPKTDENWAKNIWNSWFSDEQNPV